MSLTSDSSQPLEMGLEFNLNARFNLTEISGPGPSLQSHGKVGHETLRQPDVNRKLRKSGPLVVVVVVVVVVWKKAGGWHSGQAQRSTRHKTYHAGHHQTETVNITRGRSVDCEDQLDRWRTRTSTQEGPGQTSSLGELRLARLWLRSVKEVAGDLLSANNH